MILQLIRVLMLAMMVFISGCSTFQAIKMVNGGEVAADSQVESVIPFTLKGHPILVKARINRSQKEYTFFFDTGALTIIRQEVAKELGLPKGIEVEATDISGSSKKIELVKADILAGGMEVKDCATGVTDFSDLLPSDIAGILGSNFFRHFAVTIDYRKKEITFSRKSRQANAQLKEITIPFEPSMKNGFAPMIECMVDNSIEVSAIIDTGFPGTAALSLPLLKQTGAFKRGSAVSAKGCMLRGLFGAAKEEFYGLRIDQLMIGDLKLNNIPAISQHSKAEILLLGNRFLDRYLVTLDYPAKRMILTPNGAHVETNIITYGIALTKHDRKTVVSGVWNSSTAAAQGVEVGDEVEKVNSVDAARFSLIELTGMFQDEKINTVELELVNAKGARKINLHKEMLLPALQ